MWGIGSERRKLLNAHGIHTARELRDANEKWIQQRLTITGLRTVYELRGISCLPLEEVQPPKKGITSLRSFGEPVTDLGGLREAVASYVTRAAEKLRGQSSICGMLTVFITRSTSSNQKSKPAAYSSRSAFTGFMHAALIV